MLIRDPVLQELSREIARIVHVPEAKARIQSDGAEPIGNTPEQFAAYVKSEIGKWAKVMKDAGIEILDVPK